MTPGIAFHGSEDIKLAYLARLAKHRAADEITQGVGWETNGKTKGCAVGCTLEAYDHSRYPIELGIPEQLAHLEDCIFEGLAFEAALEWPERFLTAIPVGADLTRVWPAFVRWMLGDPNHGVRRLVLGEAVWAHQVRAAIDGVMALYANGMPEMAAAEAGAAAETRAWYQASSWAASAWYQAASDQLLALLMQT